MHGNVWEWVEDCWNASYAEKPEQLKGSDTAWTTQDGEISVLRGGSWNSGTPKLRSAFRFRINRDIRYVSYGFRMARTIAL
jgi:formylglycine-generating enzyme required for sulfatase activity